MPHEAVDDVVHGATWTENSIAVVVGFEHNGKEANPELRLAHEGVGVVVRSSGFGSFGDEGESVIRDKMPPFRSRHGWSNRGEHVVDLLHDVVDMAVDVQLPWWER